MPCYSGECVCVCVQPTIRPIGSALGLASFCAFLILALCLANLSGAELNHSWSTPHSRLQRFWKNVPEHRLVFLEAAFWQ